MSIEETLAHLDKLAEAKEFNTVGRIALAALRTQVGRVTPEIWTRLVQAYCNTQHYDHALSAHQQGRMICGTGWTAINEGLCHMNLAANRYAAGDDADAEAEYHIEQAASNLMNYPEYFAWMTQLVRGWDRKRVWFVNISPR